MRALARGGFTYGEFRAAVAARRAGGAAGSRGAVRPLPDREHERGRPARDPHRKAHAHAGDRRGRGRRARVHDALRRSSRSQPPGPCRSTRSGPCSRRWSWPSRPPSTRTSAATSSSPSRRRGWRWRRPTSRRSRSPGDSRSRPARSTRPFGRTSQLHRHQWTFVDQPVSMQRLVGAEGLSGPGRRRLLARAAALVRRAAPRLPGHPSRLRRDRAAAHRGRPGSSSTSTSPTRPRSGSASPGRSSRPRLRSSGRTWPEPTST